MLVRFFDGTFWTAMGALALFLFVAGLTQNRDRTIDDMNAELEREKEWREADARDRYLYCLDVGGENCQALRYR